MNIPIQIARFYLCSDILANCGARLRDVFYFRQHFGEVLIQLFVSLNETLEAIESRIKAEQVQKIDQVGILSDNKPEEV